MSAGKLGRRENEHQRVRNVVGSSPAPRALERFDATKENTSRPALDQKSEPRRVNARPAARRGHTRQNLSRGSIQSGQHVKSILSFSASARARVGLHACWIIFLRQMGQRHWRMNSLQQSVSTDFSFNC